MVNPDKIIVGIRDSKLSQIQTQEFISLAEKNIVGIGIDTLSPDGSNMSFPVHHKILGAGKYIIENLCHLEKLPAVGARVMALPLKIKNGSEAPCRVIAELL